MPKPSIHPYLPSAGMLVKIIEQLRKTFPPKLDTDTLRQLGLATKNESAVIGLFKFLGFIDDDHNQTDIGKVVFLKHKDDDFAAELKKAVESAYSKLFQLHEDLTWTLESDSLIGFFRETDEKSALTAARQALVFQTLAAFAGYGEIPSLSRKKKQVSGGKSTKNTTKGNKGQSGKAGKGQKPPPSDIDVSSPLGLTVRIEINLPAQGDQETYDTIFQSIRKNLLNG